MVVCPTNFRDAANDLCIVLQLESVEAVANLPEIATVPGVDCIFIGPSDLSASMGLIGQADHPDVQKMLDSAAQACTKAGKPCGILAPNAVRGADYLGYGYDWVAVGSDLGLMMGAARKDLAELRAGR